MSSDDDADAAAMAAAMGFSSFGGAKPAKKRKFNPSTDAYVEGQELEKVHRGGKKGNGSGGNQIPLGRARIIGGGAPVDTSIRNEDEIYLDDEGEEEGGVKVSGKEEEVEVQGNSVQGSEDEGGPRYIDTSQPAPAEQPNPPPEASELDTEMQTRIDAILASIEPPPSSALDTGPPGTNTSSFGLPQRLPSGMRGEYGERGGGRGGRGGGGGGNGGTNRDEKWYKGYYDPAFNENPWATLEKQNAIGSMGNWLKQGHWNRERGVHNS